MASRLASKASGTSAASRTTTSAGRWALMARTRTSAGSVRVAVEIDDLADGVDAGVGAAAGVDADALLAGELWRWRVSSVSCTVRKPGCVCQPLKSVPS